MWWTIKTSRMWKKRRMRRIICVHFDVLHGRFHWLNSRCDALDYHKLAVTLSTLHILLILTNRTQSIYTDNFTFIFISRSLGREPLNHLITHFNWPTFLGCSSNFESAVVGRSTCYSKFEWFLSKILLFIIDSHSYQQHHHHRPNHHHNHHHHIAMKWQINKYLRQHFALIMFTFFLVFFFRWSLDLAVFTQSQIECHNYLLKSQANRRENVEKQFLEKQLKCVKIDSHTRIQYKANNAMEPADGWLKWVGRSKVGRKCSILR